MSELSLKSQVFFAKRLAFLMEAEVPILEALSMLQSHVSKKSEKKIIERIIDDVSRGQSLAKSIAKTPTLFGPSDVAIITVGESTGTLRENLAYLGTELEKREKSRGKIISALIYPALVFVAAVGIISFLLLYLFPKIIPVFASLHRELPFSTQVVIGISVFLKSWWMLLSGFLLLLICGSIFFIQKNTKARLLFDQALVRIPLVGMLVRQQILAQSMRTIGVLLRSGIALPDALGATADAVQNTAYQASFRSFAECAKRGEHIADTFKTQPLLFPEVCAQMSAVGERSGNLSDSFLYLSNLYEQEGEESLARFSSLLEPALMLSMGFIIAFIAISIITPIYGITQNLHP